MKSHLYAIGLILLLQYASCGKTTWLENRMEQWRSSLLQPLAELSSQLDAKIAEYEAGKVELEAQQGAITNLLGTAPEHCRTENLEAHAKVFSTWNLEGCLNLTGDWEDGVLLGMRIGIYGLNISNSLTETLNNIMSLCAKKSFMKVVPCYYNNAKSLAVEIVDLKEKSAPYLEESKVILNNMANDLATCLGIPHFIKNKIERHLHSCREGQLDEDT